MSSSPNNSNLQLCVALRMAIGNGIQLYIPSTRVAPLTVPPKDVPPKRLISIAYDYVAWVQLKHADLATADIEINEARLKQHYYAFRQQQAYLTKPPAQRVSHVCSDFDALRSGRSYYESRNGMGGSEQVPDIVGTIEAWKSWSFSQGQGLLVTNVKSVWTPLVPLEARCETHWRCPFPPCLTCACGIYAAKTQGTAASYGGIIGKVKLWGRYLEGQHGWRAQFAYPAAFYLTAEQEAQLFTDVLKIYNVPIYAQRMACVWQP